MIKITKRNETHLDPKINHGFKDGLLEGNCKEDRVQTTVSKERHKQPYILLRNKTEVKPYILLRNRSKTFHQNNPYVKTQLLKKNFGKFLQ